MKHFKIGFLAIIAILAMSFTLISKQKVASKATDCYTGLSVKDPNNNCAASTLTRGSSSCSAASTALEVVSKSSAIDPEECGVSGGTFCCARVATATTVCPGTIGEKISAVFCEQP